MASRVLLLLALVGCAALASAVPVAQPKTALPAAKGPKAVAKGPVPVAKGPRAVAKGTVPAAKGVVAKAPRKVLPVKAAPKKDETVTVACQVSLQNPPFRISTCSVTSLAKDPVCVKLNCNPIPGAACVGGAPPKVWSPAAGKTNQNCSWVVNRDCSSPQPLYPLPPAPKGAKGAKVAAKLAGQWGFGFMTPHKGDIAVTVASYAKAVNGVCPAPAN